MAHAAYQGGAKASMRPPEFTGGNSSLVMFVVTPSMASFNEAAGIHRRKHVAHTG